MNFASHMSPGALSLAPVPAFLQLHAKEDFISFAGGVPDPGLFPFEALREAAQRILQDPALREVALQYGSSSGYLPLREKLASLVSREEAAVTPENVIVTNGSLEALDLVGKLLIGPGDAIAVTAPAYFAALDTFKPYSPRFLDVPFANGSLDMNVAAHILKQKPKFFYINTDFQNPTGQSLSLGQRHQLLHLCADEDVIIVEDGAYNQLAFDGVERPSLLQLSHGLGGHGTVIHVNTFSKTIAPGLRVGWICLPSDLRAKFVALKAASNIHTSQLNQMIALEIVSNAFESLLDRFRGVYAVRCFAMMTALSGMMPEGVTWTRPQGGIFTWLTLPSGIDAEDLLRFCTDNFEVAFLPGNLAFSSRGGTGHCRLSFATVDESGIEDGVQRFASALTAILNEKSCNRGTAKSAASNQ